MFTEYNDLYPRYYSMHPNRPERYRKVMNEDIAQRHCTYGNSDD